MAFNLGQAVMGQNVGQNQAQNLILEPGDRIRIYTTNEVPMPVSKRMRLVTLAGEVAVPGVYQALPDETLSQLLQRAGGITPHAYLFGTEFSRESVRQQQQQNLDSIIRKLEAQLEADSNQQMANTQEENAGKVQAAAMLQKQQQLAKMRNLKSSGRVSLEIPGIKTTLESFPNIALDDGDMIKIPTLPGYVSAVDEVFNENAIIYRHGKSVEDAIFSCGRGL
jgi:protein involved in polysaccharide export with SLBB domain